MAFDSIGQPVDVGDLVAYNLSGNIALGRIVSVANHSGLGYTRDQHDFKIELLAGPGNEYMNKNRHGKHISKVRCWSSVLRITSRGDLEARYG